MEIVNQEDVALARLLCLTRTLEKSGLPEIENAWRELCDRDRAALTECLIVDGIDSKAFVFVGLPLYLGSAQANPMVGLQEALRGLVQVLRKLEAQRFLSLASGRIVNVNLESLASIVPQVDSGRTLMRCLAVSHIVQKQGTVTVVMTSDSWHVLTGKLLQRPQDWSADMLEQVQEQQLKLETKIKAARQ